MVLLRVLSPYGSSCGCLGSRTPFTLAWTSVMHLTSPRSSHMSSAAPSLSYVVRSELITSWVLSAVSRASLLDSTSPHSPLPSATSFPPSSAPWFLGLAVSLPCSETLAVICLWKFHGAKTGCWLFPVACTLSKAGCYQTLSNFPQRASPRGDLGLKFWLSSY